MATRLKLKNLTDNYYWLWIALLVLSVDQLTKRLADYFLAPYDPVPALPFFNLILAHNTGAAFSFLRQAGGWQFWLFVGIAAVACTVILIWLSRLPVTQRRLGVGLALILGGALGNLMDRLLYGYVIDFIDLFFRTWHWPTFNIADTAITLGAAVVLFDTCCSDAR